MEEARVRLGALNAAWQDFETDWPKRTELGAAACELIADCPTCHRPAMVALGSWINDEGSGRRIERRYLRLVPVRTETDVAYLGAGR